MTNVADGPNLRPNLPHPLVEQLALLFSRFSTVDVPSHDFLDSDRPPGFLWRTGEFGLVDFAATAPADDLQRSESILLLQECEVFGSLDDRAEDGWPSRVLVPAPDAIDQQPEKDGENETGDYAGYRADKEADDPVTHPVLVLVMMRTRR